MNPITFKTWLRLLTPEQKRHIATALGTRTNVLFQIACGRSISLRRAQALVRASYDPPILATTGAPLSIDSFGECDDAPPPALLAGGEHAVKSACPCD